MEYIETICKRLDIGRLLILEALWGKSLCVETIVGKLLMWKRYWIITWMWKRELKNHGGGKKRHWKISGCRHDIGVSQKTETRLKTLLGYKNSIGKSRMQK